MFSQVVSIETMLRLTANSTRKVRYVSDSATYYDGCLELTRVRPLVPKTCLFCPVFIYRLYTFSKTETNFLCRNSGGYRNFAPGVVVMPPILGRRRVNLYKTYYYIIKYFIFIANCNF